MVLVLEKKFLEGVWWKYGLGLFATQMVAWFLLGYSNVEGFSIPYAIANGVFVWSGWLIFSFLPFILGRLGLHSLFWFGIAGFVFGDMAYFLLSLYEPVRLLNGLLPFIAFAQMNTATLSLGAIVEFGRYVYKKVLDE